jgi:SAM-dependent methyltransferase
VSQSGAPALKHFFGYKLRLVIRLSSNGPALGAEEERHLSPEELVEVEPKDLRADLIILPSGQKVGELSDALIRWTHPAGCIYFMDGKAPESPPGFEVTPVPGLLRKKAATSPREYGEDYLARWGDTDFMKNSELAAAQILKHLPGHKTKKTVRVLDVGCLNGYIMESLRRSGVRHVFGTDISYDLAVRHQVNPYHLAAIKVEDFLENSYPHGFSDMTICMEVLEHISPESTNRFVRELRRVTANEGVVLVSTSEDWEVDATHVNCRNRAEWYYIFSRHGLLPRGSQVIFPGFNSFVLKPSHPITTQLYRVYAWLRFKVTGPLAPPVARRKT